MLVGIVGKPSSGKSTFFKACTLVDVAISPRPFTTIKPNRGIAYIRTKCPCKEFGLTCNPKHGSCVDGTRFIPVELLDVAGLVPGAHEGRGLGNQFLNDLSRARCLIHVVDASGRTDEEGNETKGHDPVSDVRFLEDELDWWFAGILEKNWKNVERRSKTEKIQDVLADVLSGLNIVKDDVSRAISSRGAPSQGNLREFAVELRRASKPIIIAANKMDIPEADANLERIRKEFPSKLVIPVCAEGELAFRQAAAKGLIGYLPGSGTISKIRLTPEQERAIDFLDARILRKSGSTGVQEAIERAVFEFLGEIVVFPVENEGKLCDKAGNVLPDAVILDGGSNPVALAGAIHTDLAKNFISAVDARTKMRVSADHVLKTGDVIKIVVGK